MARPLTLHEEFLLLALREETGTAATGDWLEYPLAAGILSELLLQKRLTIDAMQRRKQLIDVIGVRPVGDAVADEALKRIRQAKRRASLTTWVDRLSRMKRLKDRVALQLCERGILRADEQKVLRIFKREVYPEIDPKPERRLVERLRKAIFSDAQEIAPRDVILIALAHHTSLLEKKFAKKELKPRYRRIKKIADGSLTAQAAKEIMDAMYATVAVFAAIP
jgi:hypothetical protein